MENKFKKGLILGGLLTIGAAIGFVMSQSGKELSEELQKDLKTLSKHLKKSLHNLEDVTKESYATLVATVVEEYAKKKEMTNDAKKALVNALEKMWQEMVVEYQAEQDNETTKK